MVVEKSIEIASLKGEEEISRYLYMDHVDEVCDIQKVMLGSELYISLQKFAILFDETPDWSGYIKL